MWACVNSVPVSASLSRCGVTDLVGLKSVAARRANDVSIASRLCKLEWLRTSLRPLTNTIQKKRCASERPHPPCPYLKLQPRPYFVLNRTGSGQTIAVRRNRPGISILPGTRPEIVRNHEEHILRASRGGRWRGGSPDHGARSVTLPDRNVRDQALRPYKSRQFDGSVDN